jgi:hypothetical protein
MVRLVGRQADLGRLAFSRRAEGTKIGHMPAVSTTAATWQGASGALRKQ